LILTQKLGYYMSIDKDKGVIGYYEKRDEKAQTWFIECA
jgi:hypothetical protein